MEERDNLILVFIELESKDITIERTHRTGSKINGKKKAIIVTFLNYKNKHVLLKQYKQKIFWKDNIYVNEDYSKCTTELKKQLLEQEI